jgi:type VI protein secretion system component VasK
MSSFFRLIAAGPMFFVSAWLLMLFVGATDADTGVHPFGYVTAMVVTIGLWLTVAPAVGAIAGKARTKRPKKTERADGAT